MKVTVVGAGYVGLVTAVGLSALGHDVTCLEKDERKLGLINSGKSPIYEKGMEKISIKAGADADLAGSDIILISVGTPTNPDYSQDLSQIESASMEIGKALADSSKFNVVVVRSTVFPGTTEDVVQPIIEKNSSKKAGSGFGIAMMPEFLREGTALDDFSHPDRVVIGIKDEKTREIIGRFLEPFKCTKFFTSIRSSEMIKYASNAFLAARIATINELSEVCEKVGVDIDDVADAIGADARIGNKFLDAGPGFGGSCFPKDVKALISNSERLGLEPAILQSVISANEHHTVRVLEKLEEFDGKEIAVLGLSFKPGTDDVRESPSIKVISKLIERGARVRAYDPQAMENMRKIFPKIRYCIDMDEALSGCDAAIIMQEWDEFRKSASYFKKILGDRPLLDCRRILTSKDAEEAGLSYLCIGRG